MLAYKLPYKYSKSSLSFRSLKGSDHFKFRQLDEACKDEWFLLYLAHIKEDTSGCDEGEEWGGNDRFGCGYIEDLDDCDEDSDSDDEDEED